MVATLNLTRHHKNSHKKTVSVACAKLLFSDISPGAADINQLFVLPPNAVITHAAMIVETASNAAETVAFGFAGGTEFGAALAASSTGYKQSTEVVTLTTLTGTTTLTSGAVTGTVNALTLNEGTPNTLNAGTIVGTVTTLTGTCTLTSGAGTVVHSPRILTATGKTVTAAFSAKPTVGVFHFMVEYIEYTLDNGDLTNYV